jgi:predicted permease
MAVLGLLSILANVVLPVFLIAGVGFIARRALGLDPRPIARLSLYVLVPALLFNSLSTTTMGGDEIARIGAYAALLSVALIALGMAGSRLFGVTRSEASGLTLAVAFMNATNYGLPVSLFAFGQEGFERAVVFAAFESILTFSLAAFIAARGKLPWQKALLPMIQIPVLWAALAALLLRSTGIELPPVAQRTVALLAQGTIPVIILLLGMQIAGMRLQRMGIPAIAACAGRLVVSPLLGLALVALLQPSPLTAKVLVLGAAMPTAVNAVLLATEFDSEPELVSGITLLTTLISIGTVTAWVAYLQGG